MGSLLYREKRKKKCVEYDAMTTIGFYMRSHADEKLCSESHPRHSTPKLPNWAGQQQQQQEPIRTQYDTRTPPRRLASACAIYRTRTIDTMLFSNQPSFEVDKSTRPDIR